MNKSRPKLIKFKIIMTIFFVMLSMIKVVQTFSYQDLTDVKKIENNLLSKAAADWGSDSEIHQEPNGPRDGCPATDYSLVALVPRTMATSFTSQTNPNLWFYFPYTRDTVSHATFIIKNESENNDIYFEFPIDLPEQPGFISIALPNTTPPLDTSLNYLGSLNLFCGEKAITPIFVRGWIQFTETDMSTSQDYDSYLRDGLFLDAVDTLAQQRFAEPDNTSLVQAWERLLQELEINPEWVPTGPILGPVTVYPDSSDSL